MKNIGLASGTVKLLPYDDDWQKIFVIEANKLSEVLNINLVNIQHVGSTAIPGMIAKPIIDIAILVASLDIAETWNETLKNLNYEYKGIEPDLPDRRFFAKGPKSNRTVYLHIVNQKEWNSLIKFRDSLKSNQYLANEYASLKKTLAYNYPNDRIKYTISKNDFIVSVLND